MKSKIKTKVKIKASTYEELEKHVANALNIVALFVRGGELPTTDSIEKKEINGQWWTFNNSENSYEIFQTQNNHKAFIRQKELEDGKPCIVLEFYYRYDNKEKNGYSFNEELSKLVVRMLGEDVATLIE